MVGDPAHSPRELPRPSVSLPPLLWSQALPRSHFPVVVLGVLVIIIFLFTEPVLSVCARARASQGPETPRRRGTADPLHAILIPLVLFLFLFCPCFNILLHIFP